MTVTASLSRRVGALEPPTPASPTGEGNSLMRDLELLIADGRAAAVSIFDAEQVAWLRRCCEGDDASAADLELFAKACALPTPSADIAVKDYLRALSRFLTSCS